MAGKSDSILDGEKGTTGDEDGTDSADEGDLKDGDPFVASGKDKGAAEERLPGLKEGESSTEYYKRLSEKFQSEKDKAVSDAVKKALGDNEEAILLHEALDKRPDLWDQIERGLKGGATKPEEKEAPEFYDPEAARTDVNSESYKFRQQQDKKLVEDTVKGLLGEVARQSALQNTGQELRDKFGFDDEQIKSFNEFITTPKDQLPLDSVVEVFMKAKGITSPEMSSALEKVRKNKEALASAGAVGGVAEAELDARAALREIVLKAAARERGDIF